MDTLDMFYAALEYVKTFTPYLVVVVGLIFAESITLSVIRVIKTTKTRYRL